MMDVAATCSTCWYQLIDAAFLAREPAEPSRPVRKHYMTRQIIMLMPQATSRTSKQQKPAALVW